MVLRPSIEAMITQLVNKFPILHHIFIAVFTRSPHKTPFPITLFQTDPLDVRRLHPAFHLLSCTLFLISHFSPLFFSFPFFSCWYFPRNAIVVCQIVLLFVRRWLCRYPSSSAFTYSSCWWSRSFHLHRLSYRYSASTSSSPWSLSPSGTVNFLFTAFLNSSFTRFMNEIWRQKIKMSHMSLISKYITLERRYIEELKS